MERRTRIRWDRLGRWALIAVLGFVLYLYVGPAATWVSTYKEAGRKRADVAALKAENQRLRERRRDLRDPAALEREARRLGMVKAGEKSYVVEGLPRPASRNRCRTRTRSPSGRTASPAVRGPARRAPACSSG